jgi:2-hydroxychromene-2-carboxylate isomerase
MHRRIHSVLHALGVEGRFRRVYTWSSHDYPLWARALVYAHTVGKEDRLFEELLVAKSQRVDEVFAAANRAGLDVAALRQALQDPTPPARLVRDRDLAQKARLQGLPTIDIGRRRMMGEVSEADVRDAIQAALAGR